MAITTHSGQQIERRPSHLQKKGLRKSRLYWKHILASLITNGPPLRLAGHVRRGWQILQQIIWKHHFSPVDTINALSWMTSTTSTSTHVPSSTSTSNVIDNLPLEIVDNIFTLVTHGNYDKPENRYYKELLRSSVSSGTSPTTPLHLSHVCRSWRTFVHGTPFLWSTLVVQSPHPKHVDLISFWLDRSADYPLDLSLEQYVYPDPASCVVADLFVAQAHRWRRISLNVSIQYPFRSLKPSDTPRLEEFRVRLDKWNSGASTQFIQVLHSSPVLHTINWGKSISYRIPTDTPWSRLRKISLHNLEVSDVLLDGLSQCHSLQSLYLHRMKKPSVSHTLVVDLPHVERLVYERASSFPYIFDFFTLPSLHDLEITTFLRDDLDGTQLTSLVDMIDRSGCRLKSLSIDRDAFPILSIPVSDGLIALNVSETINESHLIALTRRSGDQQGGQLPHLRHIFLKRCDSADGILADMLRSRRKDLRTIHVCIDHNVPFPRDNMTLECLKQDGIDVRTQEPFYEEWMVSALRPAEDIFCSELENERTPTIRLPDNETLWT